MEELFSSNKFDESSLRYYFAIFRRVGEYDYKLKILPPENASDIDNIIDSSQERGQVVETDEENKPSSWMGLIK